jgi:nicotinate-nucleotide pyrophosphorylase
MALEGERNVRAVAETGVDLISVGALTNSVDSLDISLRFL